MATFPTVNKAPGVYIQEITLPGPIPALSTSNAAFVGPSAVGPLLKPTQLTSVEQFNAIFGDYVEDPYRVFAAHAVRGFFAEGGQLCYFVRVGTGVQASLKLMDRASTAQAALKVTALKEGTGGNSTTVQVDDASLASTTFSKAQTAPQSTAADKKSITVTPATDAANFLPGDVVSINQAANSDTATVSSVSGAVINFQAPLANTYTGGTLRIADISAGQKKIRVADASHIEPGSYITISDGTNTETGVVRVVTSVTNASPVPNLNLLTLTGGLTNSFKMGSGDPAVTIKSVEFKLTIFSTNAGTEIFNNLSMDPRHSQYFGDVVDSKVVTVKLWDPPSTTPLAKNIPAVIVATNLAGGKADDLAGITTLNYHDGIDTLKKIDDVNLLCVPDAVNAKFTVADTQDIQAYMIAHCEHQQDRFAILDPIKPDTSDITFSKIDAQRSTLNSDNGYGALYFPWIAITNPFAKGQIFVPPSGHIAGVYANSDNNFGVFRAPANEQVTSALAVQITLTDEEQGPRNEKGINVIRSFPSQGIKIWGARTIAPPDVTAWRFVNVRRLTTFIEKSIQAGTRFAVFLPNNLTLWQQIKRMVTDFLQQQWVAGALFGDTPDKAFRVRVDETINPPAVTALGQLIVQVTIRPTTPAEFIVFQVIQDITGSTLQESTAA
jgi:phage tail sheath protein FI